MGGASKYWRFVRLNATGHCQVEEVPSARAFFQQEFPNWAQQAEGSELEIQRRLLNYLRDESAGTDTETQRWAECCLRCLISNQIRQVCQQLEAQFGSSHGFIAKDLWPFVLDDTGDSWIGATKVSSIARPAAAATAYTCLATTILHSFDPERGNLSTWVIRLVRNHPELNRFLLEHGVYRVSDWAILNDTHPRQLPRILGDFHALTAVEVEQATQLLQSYHAVYRRDRMQQRQAGSTGRCSLPTSDQLLAIAAQEPSAILTDPSDRQTLVENTMNRLQYLASYLRQYRIAVRGGHPPTESLDQPEVAPRVWRMQEPDSDQGNDVHTQFLTVYRQQFLQCLDQTLAQVTQDRMTYLQSRKGQTAEQFLKALYLFHCQGQAMGQIARQVGLTQQYQVTRLLKLKNFRADVRQRLLVMLRDRVLQEASIYVDVARLQTLEQQIETALDHQISGMIQEAEAEASVAHNQPFQNLLSRRLCHYLDARSFVS